MRDAGTFATHGDTENDGRGVIIVSSLFPSSCDVDGVVYAAGFDNDGGDGDDASQRQP